MTTASRLARSNTTYVSVKVSGSKNAWMCMTVSPLKRVATEVPWPASLELADGGVRARMSIVRAEPERVVQHRHGEDRAAASEQAQRKADRERQDQTESDHGIGVSKHRAANEIGWPQGVTRTAET